MVSISDQYKSLKISVDVKSNVCQLISLNSGIGKSYYTRIVCELVEKSGLGLAKYVKYDSKAVIQPIISNSVHLYLLVLDELELYGSTLNYDSLYNLCDNIWCISRLCTSLPNDKMPLMRLEVSSSEVRLYEAKNII